MSSSLKFNGVSCAIHRASGGRAAWSHQLQSRSEDQNHEKVKANTGNEELVLNWHNALSQYTEAGTHNSAHPSIQPWSMKDGQSFGYQEFFSPRPRALVSEYAFRPVSYSTINPSIVYPESMINLIGGGHVRRRRSGSLVEASPIVRTVNQLDNRRLRVDDPFFIYALQRKDVLPHHPSAMRASCPVQSRVTDLL
ncbi:hypothetical protein F5877DRAFT_84210 [Lentinula edodes]|nr:hypothetical protein F5877DRAFT_84210 [Lentinula edodes]